MTRRPTVSIICAPPNGFNPGMTSVDLAARHIGESINADVTYWRLWDQCEWLEAPGGSSFTDAGTVHDVGSGLTYAIARGCLDEVFSADLLIFWGDFLHMAVYLRQTADVLARRMELMSFDDALDLAARLYLMRESDVGIMGRSITYGSTLSFNTAADYAGSYGMDLARFVEHARRAWFRDPYSAAVAETFRGDELSCKAPDAAFLLPSASVAPERHRLGIFIGRSNFQPEAVAAFGRQIARALDLEPAWIPWGADPGFWPMEHRRRFRAAWPGLEHLAARPSAAQVRQTLIGAVRGVHPRRDQPTMAALFDAIANCSAIVTDTYHLAVNAWRIGIPTVCLTDRDHREWNVNAGSPGSFRDKRYDLYSQLDALPLLVDGSRLRAVGDRSAQTVATILRDGTVSEVARSRAAAMTESATQSLTRAIRAALGS